MLLLTLTACSGSRAQETSTEETGVAKVPASQVSIDLEKRPGTDWPQFLGPTHDNISTETGLLDQWPPQGPPIVWEKEVGTGYSAPSVRGHKLVLHHRIGDEEIVECFHAATGKSLWKHTSPSQFVDPYGYNNGPRCSPILTEDHCYVLGAEGYLACLKLDDGAVVWSHKLREEYTIPDGFFGVGATPILEGNKLIVLVGGQPNSGVVAFDPSTGQKLWESVGKSTWAGAETGWTAEPEYEWTGEEMVVSYSSPIAATIHGQRHLLCLMRQGLVSLDPETGTERFHYWFMSRTYESVNAARPVVVDDTILLGAAYRVGSVLLQVSEDGTGVTEVWKDPRQLMTHWSTALYHDGCFFGFSGRHENEGTLQCVDAKTGDMKWQTPGWDRLNDLSRGLNGEIIDQQSGKEIPWPLYGRGSKIFADGKFIILAERGTLALVDARTEEWKEVSRCAAPRMHYPSWTAPVLSRGLLFLRCEDALVCLDLLPRTSD
ncbi:MAG: PQQ-binding-like beta-propeller repeat protein [Planctomycetaceae bacterium]|nr:PQQ-binding-like beta-propeller repeat protein [Planctomycetaceae bacterium]